MRIAVFGWGFVGHGYRAVFTGVRRNCTANPCASIRCILRCAAWPHLGRRRRDGGVAWAGVLGDYAGPIHRQ